MRRALHSVVLVAIALMGLGDQPVAGQAPKPTTPASVPSSTVAAVGDVLYPGEYPLTPGLTALELLTLAGGSPADTAHSLIVRRNRKARGGHDEIPFDPNDDERVRLDPNERLRPDDVLIVRGVYVLRPDEVLQIDVAGYPRLSGRYIVQDDKSVILPTGDRLSVGNDTEFRLHIVQALSAKLPGSPKVDVTVARPRGPRAGL